jgi:hypothetical protein
MCFWVCVLYSRASSTIPPIFIYSLYKSINECKMGRSCLAENSWATWVLTYFRQISPVMCESQMKVYSVLIKMLLILNVSV